MAGRRAAVVYLVLVVVVVVAWGGGAADAAVQCSTVLSGLSPCMSYFTDKQVTSSCCSGMQKVNLMGQTKQDRVAICNCISDYVTSSGISAATPETVSTLSKYCGLSIAVPTDGSCAKVS